MRQSNEVSTRHIKQKRCKQCKEKFSPVRPLQFVCSPSCAYLYAAVQRERKEKKDWKQRKKILKSKTRTISEERGELQKIFNEYIRERDRGLPCISCGTENPNILYAASHYFNVGEHPSVRFDEDNTHKSCANYCNIHKRGNLINYRPALIKKIGQERFDALSIRATQTTTHLTLSEIVEMKKLYRQKIKSLKNK